MTARIIDGKIIASDLRARVAEEVAKIKREHQLTPGLAVVLVGNDPASEVYVRSKHTQTQAAGMASFEHKLPAEVAQADLLALIAKLNGDPDVHGDDPVRFVPERQVGPRLERGVRPVSALGAVVGVIEAGGGEVTLS